ncbi:hypothetical protein OF376_00505 [Ureaplasma miroungigenitalium]|uniref:O-methyltransferase n=1 Tax=Ureaplasma miroungigenitalium TaxID=1042321 RepID=A0ABT3BLY9_9BACT|nr:hypothetical protein [Ureaplasma miroungigenitalium]MCV3728270.1 hypothetical protein [Ureaplasma miroungigenitalium]MCV3734075.1 hypothetical protein [Ureaplasma miroungigenitalium]
MTDRLITLQTRCLKEKIPLMREQTIKYIIEQMNQHKVTSYLEIGTAYGYSALSVKTFVPTLATLVTLEKDETRVQIAHSYLQDLPGVQLVHTDCFVYEPEQLFDVIVLDGPKGQQITLFEKYIKFLKPQGQMFIDNLFLKALREQTQPTKNQTKLLMKVDAFVDYLQKLTDYHFTMLDIDDGLGIITKK